MEPTSPKGRDLRERAWYALHNGVPDTEGSGGEFFVAGKGRAVGDAATREIVARAASYEPAEHYVLFELMIGEARCNGYGDVALPSNRRWSASQRTTARELRRVVSDPAAGMDSSKMDEGIREGT